MTKGTTKAEERQDGGAGRRIECRRTRQRHIDALSLSNLGDWDEGGGMFVLVSVFGLVCSSY